MNARVRLLSLGDVPECLRLSEENGWNQLASDWSRLIQYCPELCFAATIGNSIVGTITATPYDASLAWIGMMLVDARHRRRGIATELLQHAIAELHQQGVKCIKLDATPLGQKLYEQMGFRVEWSYQRCERDRIRKTNGLEAHDEAASLGRGEVNGLLPGLTFGGAIDVELDRLAFGVDRSWLLGTLQRDSYQSVTCRGGYGLMRRGKRGDYLGPVIATSTAIADAMVETLLSEAGDERTVWDVPSSNQAAVDLAESNGFRAVRELTRMRLGDGDLNPRLDLQYALAGPSVG